MKGRISDCIPYGKENAVSRAYLVKITGLPDRTIRNLVKEENKRLCKQGEAILSSSSNRGYWRTDSPAEMLAYIHEADHRCREIQKNMEPIKKLLEGGQTCLDQSQTGPAPAVNPLHLWSS